MKKYNIIFSDLDGTFINTISGEIFPKGCGACGDDYSGYLLFPTHKDNEYFVLWYKC